MQNGKERVRSGEDGLPRRERIGKRMEDDAYQTYFGVRRTAIIRSSNERRATTDWASTQERDRAERFSQMCSSPDLNKEPDPVIRLGLRLLNGYAMISSSKLIHESDDN